MLNLRAQKIIPFTIFAIIIAISIAALVTLARFIFYPDSPSVVSQVDISKEALLSLDEDHSVIFKARGPILAEELARSYQIKISSNGREITTYKGYSGQLIDSVLLTNNDKAYEQFVFALYKANLIKGNESSTNADLRGVCASGFVYEFSVIANNNETKRHLWTSTCSGSKGSLSASSSQIISLFMDQIPNSKDIINNIR